MKTSPQQTKFKYPENWRQRPVFKIKDECFKKRIKKYLKNVRYDALFRGDTKYLL